jgi:hypothetical protein
VLADALLMGSYASPALVLIALHAALLMYAQYAKEAIS